MTYSFVSKEEVSDALADPAVCLQIENPLNSEQDLLRSSMVSSHLKVVSRNQSAQYNGVYEISRVYKKDKKLAQESWKLAITFWGDDSLLRLKGAIDQIMGIYRLEPAVSRDMNNKLYYSNRSARLGSGFGGFGQITKSVLDKFGIKREVSFGELAIEDIIAAQRSVRAIEPVAYQLVSKDISIELDDITTFYEVKSCIEKLVHKVVFRQEFSSDDLSKQSRKRLTFTVIMNLGPNPTSEQIQDVLKKCASMCESIPKAKVL